MLCTISSAIYILNDIKDVNADQNHSEKKNRPLVKGDISINQTKKIFVLFLGVGLISSFFLSWKFSVVLLILILNTTIYSIFTLALFYFV